MYKVPAQTRGTATERKPPRLLHRPTPYTLPGRPRTQGSRDRYLRELGLEAWSVYPQVSRDLPARYLAKLRAGAAHRAACRGRRFIQAFAADSTEPGGAGEASPLFRAGAVFVIRRRLSAGRGAQAQLFPKSSNMDDEEETYRLWKIRKTIMQASRAWGGLSECRVADGLRPSTQAGVLPRRSFSGAGRPRWPPAMAGVLLQPPDAVSEGTGRRRGATCPCCRGGGQPLRQPNPGPSTPVAARSHLQPQLRPAWWQRRVTLCMSEARLICRVSSRAL